MRYILLSGLLSLALAGCGAPPAPKTPDVATKTIETPGFLGGGGSSASQNVSFGPLPEFFDCVRENGTSLVASHRGGPAPGYPENGLETLQNALKAGIYVHEVDVAESRDGVLFLLHDRSLGRTTSGTGFVADTDWSEISRLRLIDNAGTMTSYSPPKLSEVLLWARDSGAIVELDKKDTTSFRNIISQVRAARAEENVILITYNDQQALEVARLAPDLMMTATIRSADHQRELERGGLNSKHVIAWMGTNTPNGSAFRALGRRGIETAFGTLGRPGQRLDDRYIADGNLSEFQDLVDDGLTLIATDEAYRVAEYLSADDAAISKCAMSR